jgi:sporulation protein YlmC with PRC-barrel domain
MRKLATVTVISFAALTVAGGAFAQSTTGSGLATTAPATHTTADNNGNNGANATYHAGGMNTGMSKESSTANASTPSDRNPVLTDNGDARASKVIGSAVYNDHNDKVGSIDDIVIPKQGSGQLEAVISVGGFLGIGTKYVAVPYNELKFGNTTDSSDNKVVLAGATKDSLMKMGSFNYTHNG